MTKLEANVLIAAIRAVVLGVLETYSPPLEGGRVPLSAEEFARLIYVRVVDRIEVES